MKTILRSDVLARGLLCAALSGGLMLPAHAAAAPLATRVAPQEIKTSVLSLEGDEIVGEAIADALRKEFADRGYTGGDPLSLVELRLTMGCETNDPDCLAGGGEALGVSKLIYGAVRPAEGGGYTITLEMLDVAGKKVERETSLEVALAEVDGDAVRTTATRLAALLMGEPDPVVAATPAEVDTPEQGPGDEGVVDPEPKADKGNLVWGPYKPRPAWKYAGLGVSAGLLAGSIGAAAAITVMISPNGSVRKDLIKAAEDSLNDSKPSNDVDPNMEGDLCEAARAEPPGEPGTVTNAAVTKICNRADGLAKGATGAWIAAGVTGAATIAFTTLLFVHKEKPAVAALRRRGVTLGAAPTRGGATVSGGFRF